MGETAMKHIFTTIVAGAFAISSGQIARADTLERPFGTLIAQQTETNLAKAEGDKGPKYKLETTVTYDDWKNDFEAGDEGEVISEKVILTVTSEDVGDAEGTLELKVEGAHVDLSVARGASSESTSHLADTKASIAYKFNLDRSIKANIKAGPWDAEVKANFNLPTGVNEASKLELLAKPTKSIVSANFLGTGFDYGLTTKVTRKLKGKTPPISGVSYNKDSNFFLGFGATRRGGFDSDADPDKGNVESGIQFKAFAGFKEIEFANMS